MSNGLSPTFAPGQWNAVCDRCGADFKSSELRRTWQGWMCCTRCWEPRHPQDFVRGVKDTMTPPWTRPPVGIPAPPAPSPSPSPAPSPTPAPPAVVSSSAIPGIAVPGQAIPGSLL